MATRRLLLPLLFSLPALTTLARPSDMPPVPQVIMVANVTGDDTASLRSAWTCLTESQAGPVTLQFAPGRYDFFDGVPPETFVVDGLGGLHDLTIEGTDTTLVFHGFDPNVETYKKQIFRITDMDGLQIRGITVRLARPPYSTGVIVQKGTTSGSPWVGIKLDESYPDLQSDFVLRRTSEFDHVTKDLLANGADINPNASPPEYAATVLPAPGTPFVKLEAIAYPSSPQLQNSLLISRLTDIPIGQGIFLVHSKYQNHFVYASDCSNVVIDAVTLHDMPGNAFILRNCDEITFDGVVVTPFENRLMSTSADIVHVTDPSGKLTLRNCTFKRQGDNGLDYHGKYLRIDSIDTSTNELSLSKVLGLQGQGIYQEIAWQAGDTLEFSAGDLSLRGTSAASTNLTSAPPSSSSDYVINVAQIPSAVVAGDVVADLSRLPSEVEILNCTFEGNKTGGVVLKGTDLSSTGMDVSVIDCTFRKNVGVAILIETDLSRWNNSSRANGIQIKNCVIDGANRVKNPYSGAISIVAKYMLNPPNELVSPVGIHRNILIENCDFMNLTSIDPASQVKCAIYVSAAADVDLKRNVFTSIDLPFLLRMENADPVRTAGNNCATGYAGMIYQIINNSYFELVPENPFPICPNHW